MDLIQGKMQIAVEYGLDVAILMHNMVYWTEKNMANDRNFREGRYWTYNTLDALAKIYPLWSKDQIKRIIGKCRDAGLLLVSEFNEDRRDRTKWYSPSDDVLALYEIGAPSIWRNRQMHLAESPRADGENATPLPSNILQDYIPPIVPQKGTRSRRVKSVPDHKPERFEAFWKFYPRKESRIDAVRAWDKLKPSDELIAQMGLALKWQMAREEWQRGVGIPYAATWLNKRRWEDVETKVIPERNTADDGWDGSVVEY